MQSLIKQLQHYNDWRRGKIDALELSPAQIGVLIDQVIEVLRQIEKASTPKND